MPTSNKFLLDYLPAELHETQSGWYISYYVANPATQKLVRKRIKWNTIKNVLERRRAGKQLCQKINIKLASGWNPFIEQEAPKSFTEVTRALDLFIYHNKKAAKDGAIRPDTLRSYTSYITNLKNWWISKKKAEPYTHALTQANIRQFLDYIYYERDNTPRTHNNYLVFLATLGRWLVEQQYCKANPAHGISRKREGDKQRAVIPEKVAAKIWEYTQKQPAWHCLCKTIYFTFVRRTELTLLQLKHINLATQSLTIPASISKNRKTATVTLPVSLVHLFAAHMSGYTQQNWYLFGADEFKPGPEPCTPKKISDTWAKMRKHLNLPAQYQFYSLKDTGITNMLLAGLPAIVVRDQARHHDISMTNTYTTSGNNTTNADIKKL